MAAAVVAADSAAETAEAAGTPGKPGAGFLSSFARKRKHTFSPLASLDSKLILTLTVKNPSIPSSGFLFGGVYSEHAN